VEVLMAEGLLARLAQKEPGRIYGGLLPFSRPDTDYMSGPEQPQKYAFAPRVDFAAGIPGDVLRALDIAGRATSGEMVTPRQANEVAMTMMGGSAFGRVPAGALATGLMARGPGASKDARFWHPVGGGKKLSRPVEEMTSEVAPLNNMVDRRALDIAEMQGGVLIPAIGDRSAAGGLLSRVNETNLSEAVKLEGGPNFMRTHAPYNEAWASDKGVVTSLGRRVRNAAKDGADVFLAYSPMAHTTLDFNTMMSDALVAQLSGAKITKKAKAEFDRKIKQKYPSWPGIDDAKVGAFLRSSDGLTRTAIVREMDKPKWRSAGFPDVAATRKAITEPGLLDADLNASGYAVAKMDPTGRSVSAPLAPHSTYNAHLAGEYIGGLAAPVPREILFRDFFKERFANRPPNFNPANTGDNRAFMMSNVEQPVDQELVDAVSTYLRQNPQ